jgi:hypothetical protein
MRKKRPQRIDIVYDYNGTRIEFVPKLDIELDRELCRILEHGRWALRQLNSIKRSPHPSIANAIFQLNNIGNSVVDPTDPYQKASEIARVSEVYREILDVLGDLKHSEIEPLKQARFFLLYGQAHEKRAPEEIGTKLKLDNDDEEIQECF